FRFRRRRRGYWAWCGGGRDGRVRAVRLAVEDNGAGFPAHILARAFEPYVTTKSGGTGLGLAMVKKIVDEHGARVELANRAEGGARVTLLIRRLALPA
ncbi:MAG: ATP-binding protein, partial [Betaproteobacteria bacterium]